jgi:hypothetical protein
MKKDQRVSGPVNLAVHFKAVYRRITGFDCSCGARVTESQH